ncbi:MAG: type III pantothenate kinase [Rhodocyclaceae bacterium]|nr:type III pantothenate kinase [Rhodocyclaceae bacterium]
MIVCIDGGNTRLKWGLRNGDRWSRKGGLANRDLAGLAAAIADAAGATPIGRLLACNVAGAPTAAAVDALAARLGAATEWVTAEAERCGVRNSYDQPAQLGADRWTALIGARALHRGPCLVVCAGTATTVDVLRADGVFAGGLIVPGLDLMRRSLAQGTAGLPLAVGRMAPLPRNTDDAIASGCLQATLGAVERMFRPMADDSGAACLLSGGAAAALAPHLVLPCRLVEDLVLEGLARIGRPA